MSQQPTPQRNALAGETSPYLLQHAGNPVDWYPWGEAALEKARTEGKPILLSVGYSACHWCHVMAHESFEDEATAAIMNAHFVNIKVDREERPDIDRIYQIAQQMLTQRNGGWPLTMFLTHDDHMPFFGGTYFPGESRYGLPSFREVLKRIAEFYRGEQGGIRRQNASLKQALDSMQTSTAGVSDNLNPQPLQQAAEHLKQNYDPRHGGFNGAPKFPHPTHIDRLLRFYALENDNQARDMALETLRHMADGGIYDHLGGGFCRYSVDAEWTIPHFEKMLYDNGPLLALYSEAWQVSGADRFQQVVEETAGWLLREMRAPEGGFYSSLDADSEGEEGKYYVWTPDQVEAVLQKEDQRLRSLVVQHYGLDQPPNFEGRWHLRVRRPLADVAGELDIPATEAQTLLDAARELLFAAREQRIRPGRDDKLLVSWNALLIKGLATAGRVFERDDWIDAAGAALDCLHERLWQDGRLLATYKDGRAHLNAYLDDYAFLLDAILTLLQARWRRADLDFAMKLAEVLLKHYQDPNGGFFFTADDHEQLIQRSKPLMDDSLPNGNGIAAYALQRLGHLVGEPRYLDAATRTLQVAWPDIERMPFAHDTLLLALEESLHPPALIILRAKSSQTIGHWKQQLTHGYQPRRLLFAITGECEGLPGPLAAMSVVKGQTTAYVCVGTQCSAPLQSVSDVQSLLEKS